MNPDENPPTPDLPPLPSEFEEAGTGSAGEQEVVIPPLPADFAEEKALAIPPSPISKRSARKGGGGMIFLSIFLAGWAFYNAGHAWGHYKNATEYAREADLNAENGRKAKEYATEDQEHHDRVAALVGLAHSLKAEIESKEAAVRQAKEWTQSELERTERNIKELEDKIKDADARLAELREKLKKSQTKT